MLKNNARLIGIFLFFVALGAITLKWQGSDSAPVVDGTTSEQFADAPSDYSSASLALPDDPKTDRSISSEKKPSPRKVAAKKSGINYRKVSFPPGKGTISGKVTMRDNMDVPPDLQVVLHFVNDKSESNFKLDTAVLETEIDTDGRFGFEELPLGEYHVYAIAEGNVGHAPAKLTSRRPKTMVTLAVVEASIIQGNVVDSEGLPVANASVFAVSWRQGSGESAMALSRSRSSQVLTDGTGAFTIHHVQVRPQAIDYRLMASAPRFASTVTPFLTVGDTEVEIKLFPGQEVSGTVVEPNSQAPVPNIKVVQDGDVKLNQISAVTDEAGHFVLANVSPGNYKLSIEDEAYILKEDNPAVDVVTDTPTAPVTLQVQMGGIIMGRAVDIDTNEGIPNARVYAAAERSNRGERVQKDSTSDAEGNFRIEGLPSARYRIVSDTVRGYGFATPVKDRMRKEGHAQEVQVAASGTPVNVICYYSKGLQVFGRVVDSANQPLADANVSGSSAKPDETGVRNQSSDKTDKNGLFMLGGFKPNQTVHLRAHKELYSNERRTPIELGAANHTGLTFVLRKGATIEGLVRDRNENPMPTGRLSLTQKEKVANQEGLERNGTFKFQGVKTGTYELTYSVDGNEESKQTRLATLNITEGQQLAGLQYQVNIDASRTITGLIADAQGKPVRASVNASNTKSHANAIADETGYYELAGLMDGEFQLTVSHGEYTRQTRKHVSAPSAGVNFILEGRASVSGVVTDASTGKPLPSFGITVANSNTKFGFGSRSGRFKTYTDPEGKFNFGQIETNPVVARKVVASAEGYSYAEHELGLLTSDQEISNIRLAITPSATLKGVVTDASGTPLEGAKVGPSRSSIVQRNDQFVAYTDENGRYELKSVPQGNLSFVAYQKDLDITKKSLSINGSGTYQLNFQLNDGAILEGYVTIGDTPQTGQRISIGYLSESAQGVHQNETTDKNGFYQFRNLPSGQVQMSAGISPAGSTNNRGRRRFDRLLDISSGETIQYDFRLPEATASLKGRVLNENGEPLKRAHVVMNLMSDSGNENFGQSTDDYGNFVFESLPAGHYNAVVRNRRDQIGRPVELKENEEKELNFKFGTGSTLIGTLASSPSEFEHWNLLLLNSNAIVTEPMGMEIYTSMRGQTISQAEGNDRQLILKNLHPGTFKLFAFRMPRGYESVAEMFANMSYTIQKITIKENETIEITLDLE